MSFQSENSKKFTLTFFDTIRQPCTDAFVTTAPQGAGIITGTVNRVDWIFDFDTYFAVQTKDAVNQSELVFTQRANGLTWTVNASGTIAKKGAAYRWSSTANNSPLGNGAMNEVTSGEVVPVTTGKTMLELSPPGVRWLKSVAPRP